MTALVYAVFPGVGKTYLASHATKSVLDVDSRFFSKDCFPENYIEHIKSKLESAGIVLVTCHKTVLEALQKQNIPFTLVYPQKNLKSEYLKRYVARGDSIKFIQSLEVKWDLLLSFFRALVGSPSCRGRFLADLFCLKNFFFPRQKKLEKKKCSLQVTYEYVISLFWCDAEYYTHCNKLGLNPHKTSFRDILDS